MLGYPYYHYQILNHPDKLIGYQLPIWLRFRNYFTEVELNANQIVNSSWERGQADSLKSRKYSLW